MFYSRRDSDQIEEAIREGDPDIETEIAKVIPIKARSYAMDELLRS